MRDCLLYCLCVGNKNYRLHLSVQILFLCVLAKEIFDILINKTQNICSVCKKDTGLSLIRLFSPYIQSLFFSLTLCIFYFVVSLCARQTLGLI